MGIALRRLQTRLGSDTRLSLLIHVGTGGVWSVLHIEPTGGSSLGRVRSVDELCHKRGAKGARAFHGIFKTQ